MRAAVEGIREIGRLKDWWTEGFGFWVRFVAVLGAIWGCGFVEFRLRIGDFVLVMKMAFMLIVVRWPGEARHDSYAWTQVPS
ncbi:hypothetical protein GW17_00061696 [Ensete ventricosum]|nr:hypothetical protein GW17_00061696 [Ensete ventricosum]